MATSIVTRRIGAEMRFCTVIVLNFLSPCRAAVKMLAMLEAKPAARTRTVSMPDVTFRRM